MPTAAEEAGEPTRPARDVELGLGHTSSAVLSPARQTNSPAVTIMTAAIEAGTIATAGWIGRRALRGIQRAGDERQPGPSPTECGSGRRHAEIHGTSHGSTKDAAPGHWVRAL